MYVLSWKMEMRNAKWGIKDTILRPMLIVLIAPYPSLNLSLLYFILPSLLSCLCLCLYL